MGHPETRYVAVGDADVAYQVVGDGPDLLFCYGLGSHIEFNWQVPLVAEFLDRLASLFRLIVFDRRRTGASDGVSAYPATPKDSGGSAEPPEPGASHVMTLKSGDNSSIWWRQSEGPSPT